MSAKEQLKKDVAAMVEQTKDAICDQCVWPHKETDQEAMTARCDACPIMGSIDQAVELSHILGGLEATQVAAEIVRQTLTKDNAREEQKKC